MVRNRIFYASVCVGKYDNSIFIILIIPASSSFSPQGYRRLCCAREFHHLRMYRSTGPSTPGIPFIAYNNNNNLYETRRLAYGPNNIQGPTGMRRTFVYFPFSIRLDRVYRRVSRCGRCARRR